MTEIFSFPYSMYKENNKPVFGEECDGALSLRLMLCNTDAALQKINSPIEEQKKEINEKIRVSM